jgi:hypothetical protein
VLGGSNLFMRHAALQNFPYEKPGCLARLPGSLSRTKC